MSSSFLLRPTFWFLFVGVVVIILFVYGTYLNKGKSELEKANHSIDSLKFENGSLQSRLLISNDKVMELSEIVSACEDQINKNKILIQSMRDSIGSLLFPPYVYGKYQGKLTLYSNCTNCYNLKFWVDGNYWGILNKYYKNQYTPGCNAEGTISRVLSAGMHHIEASSNNNRSWNFYVNLIEDQCLVKGIR